MLDNSMTTLVAVIVIGLISLGVGTAIGFILAGMRPQTPESGSRAPKGLIEAARLWRDRRSGKISVEIDQKFFHSRGELSVRQRAALTQLNDELQLWMGIDDIPSRIHSSAAPQAPAVNLPPPTPPTARVPYNEVPPTIRAVPPIPLNRPPAGPGVKPPSMELGDILTGAIGGESSKEPAPALRSIAAQIDEIVQQRLPASPVRGRVVKLKELPDGGIVVLVDGQRFSGIGDVADPAVRTFLQECVAEWERRAAGG